MSAVFSTTVAETAWLRKTRGEHRARILSLAMCTELYRRHNVSERAKEAMLEQDIARLENRFLSRFREAPARHPLFTPPARVDRGQQKG